MKKHYSHLICFVFTFIFIQSIVAQQVINGKVTDIKNGTPLIGATVLVKGLPQVQLLI